MCKVYNWLNKINLGQYYSTFFGVWIWFPGRHKVNSSLKKDLSDWDTLVHFRNRSSLRIMRKIQSFALFFNKNSHFQYTIRWKRKQRKLLFNIIISHFGALYISRQNFNAPKVEVRWLISNLIYPTLQYFTILFLKTIHPTSPTWFSNFHL